MGWTGRLTHRQYLAWLVFMGRPEPTERDLKIREQQETMMAKAKWFAVANYKGSEDGC